MSTMDRVIRTLNLKLAKYKEKEKETEEALHKCVEQRDHHKSLQMNYWVRLHSLTDKFSAMSLDRDRLLRTLEEKTNMEEELWARVQSSVKQAELASMEAIELQRKVEEYYLPERQKLLDAEEEIKKLKIALKRAQNDLRISKLPEKLTPKDAMVFNRHPSNKSLEEKSSKCSPASACSTTNGLQRSSCSTTNTEEKRKSFSSSKIAAEVETKLRKARTLEQQVRDTQQGWRQERQELLESIEFEKTEKNKLNHRLGMLRERNKQMQVTFDKQKNGYEIGINQLKIALRERKQENRTIFEMWKQTFDDDPSPLSRNIKKLIREFKEPEESSEEYKYLNIDNPQPVPLPTPYEMLDDTVTTTTTTSTSPDGAHHHTGGGGSNPRSSAGSHSPDRIPNGPQTCVFYKSSPNPAERASTAIAEASFTAIPPSYTSIPSSFIPDSTAVCGPSGKVDSRLASMRCPPQPSKSVRDTASSRNVGQGKTSSSGASSGLQDPPPPMITTTTSATKPSTTNASSSPSPSSSSSFSFGPLSPPRTINALLKQSLARTHLVTDQERDTIQQKVHPISSSSSTYTSSNNAQVVRNGGMRGIGSAPKVTIKNISPSISPDVGVEDIHSMHTLPPVEEGENENENANGEKEEGGKDEYDGTLMMSESDGDPAMSYHSYVLTHSGAYGDQAGGDNNNSNNNNKNNSSSNINIRSNRNNMNINDVQKEGKGESQQNISMHITAYESGLRTHSRGGETEGSKQYYNFGEASGRELVEEEYEDNDDPEEVGVDINRRRGILRGGACAGVNDVNDMRKMKMTTAHASGDVNDISDVNDINDMMILGMGPIADQLHINSLGQGWFVEDEEEEEDEKETEVYRTKYQPPLSPVIESPIRTCPEPEHEHTLPFANLGEGEFLVDTHNDAPQRQDDHDDHDEFLLRGEFGSRIGTRGDEGEANPFDMLQHDGKTDDDIGRPTTSSTAASKDSEGTTETKYGPIYSPHEGHLECVHYKKAMECSGMPNVMNSIKDYDDLFELNGLNIMTQAQEKIMETAGRDDDEKKQEKKRGMDIDNHGRSPSDLQA